MVAETLDLLVADAGIGSLAVAYLLARRSRSVGLIDVPPPLGLTTVSLMAAGAHEPMRAITVDAPVVARRAAKILLPEGSLGVEYASARLADPGDAVVILDRETAWTALRNAIVDAGGVILPAGGEPHVDERGFVAGVRHVDGTVAGARCSILGDVDVERLTAFPIDVPAPPSDAIESEWRFELSPDAVAARFGLATGEAVEWWLYGDPFDGASGFARLRAFGGTAALSVVLPLDQVLATGLDVDDLSRRLLAHPSISPLLAGAGDATVTARTLPSTRSILGTSMGDGWVASPCAAADSAVPLMSELSQAMAIAEALGDALGSPRVSVARLGDVDRRCREIEKVTTQMPLGPIDGWADEPVRRPSGLVDGLELLARRFGAAW